MQVICKPRIKAQPLGAAAVGIAVAMFLISSSDRVGGEVISYFNDLPELQMYSYPAGSSNGAGAVRDRAATFAGFSAIENGQPVFYAGTGTNPSRRGSFVVVADTSTTIPSQNDPNRYQIHSARVTLTFMGSLVYPEFGMVVPFDGTQDSSLDLTAETDGDLGHPIEMYGVGLQGGYQSFGFTSSQTGPEFFRLGDARWQALQPADPGYDPGEFNAVGPYNYFAVDAAGRDAENSVAGGYSATSVDNATTPFTPTPFAIGQAYTPQGVPRAPGDLLQPGDKLVFEANLIDPGVVRYLQRSLAAGHLAFSFSSLYQPEGHTGTAPYPDFYLDDLDVGPNPDGGGPTLEVSVTLLQLGQPGDFNQDGEVDGTDFLVWQRRLGTPSIPAGSGPDANGDGVVTGDDLPTWQGHFGSEDGAVASAFAVGEPTAGSMLLAYAGVAALMRRSYLRTL